MTKREQIARDTLARYLSRGNEAKALLLRRLPLFEVALSGARAL